MSYVKVESTSTILDQDQSLKMVVTSSTNVDTQVCSNDTKNKCEMYGTYPHVGLVDSLLWLLLISNCDIHLALSVQ